MEKRRGSPERMSQLQKEILKACVIDRKRSVQRIKSDFPNEPAAQALREDDLDVEFSVIGIRWTIYENYRPYITYFGKHASYMKDTNFYKSLKNLVKKGIIVEGELTKKQMRAFRLTEKGKGLLNHHLRNDE